MKKTKILSLLLCLSLFCALIVPGTRAYADNEPGSGMKISKTATANDDGSYTIQLEAYATGEKVITEVTKDVPTDIVLVLDQSGSMKDPIGAVSFEPYENKSYDGYIYDYNTRNQDHYENRHNGGNANLYYPLGNGAYASVSVTVEEDISYEDISNNSNNSYYWSNRNNLYASVNGEYVKVNVERTRWNGTYTYTLSTGGSVIGSGDGYYSPPKFNGIDGNQLYLAGVDDVYTYTYTDSNGKEQTIGTSTGATTVFSPTLYERVTDTSGGGSRLDALKSAANAFASAVATKAAGEDGDINTTADNVNHRIAVVGFASQSGNGNNTELLSIAGNNSDSVGVAYNDITNQNLKDVVQNMDTADGQTMVTNAIKALAAEGATEVDLGMDMAQRILNANPVPTGETRNRVVIVFTDGSPTNRNGFQRAVANSAISTANAIKAGGTTVYSIGIFSGADASTAGKEPDKDYYEDFLGWTNYTDAEMSAACNWFMQKVSSNNGTPRTPSYYLSAGDEVSLNSIFKQISDQIETGGSSTTLDANAEIRDVVSNAFTMPEKTTDINLYTAESNGSTDSWKSRVSFNGTTSINESERTISVSGFSFKDNWCGNEKTNGQTTFHDGKKLIIEFTVKPEAGFLGGNNVFTNGEKSGLYENSSAENALEAFPQPQVNVPIQNVTVTAADKNVYLLGGLTADELKSGATVTVGEGTKAVSLDLSKANENYGLETWQTAYVDIAVEVKDANGTVVTGLTDLTADTTYTISVTVAPKTAGSITAKTGTSTPAAKINVFKPELTFEDSEVYYGADAPTKEAYDANNLTATAWKHGETLDTTVTMIGTAPELDLTYTPEGGKVNTKQDIAVDVAVKINGTDVTGHTTFVHTKCADDNTCTDPANGKFWLHIQTCTLNITKQGGAADESYVFDVYKGGEKYSEVTVWGNGTETLVELPIGTYSISENAGWSWRYSANNGGSAALTAQNPTGSIACTNTKNNNQWLNGFSEVVRNIFDTNH